MRKLSVWRNLGLVAAAAGIWAVVAFSQTSDKKDAQAPAIRSAKVTTGPIERTVRVTGSTAPRDYVTIAAPMMRGPDSGRALVLMYLVPSGKIVKKGEVIGQIDGTSLKDHIDDLDSQIVQATADVKKRKAEQAIDWENMQQTLRQAKSDWDKAKLDEGASEIRMPIDAEVLKLATEEAEARYKELQGDLKTKQESYRAELRILDITRERHLRHRNRHKHDHEKFTIRAPMDGLAVMNTIWRTGEYVQIGEGDQLSPGQSFMKVVNPGTMQVEATVSQVTVDDLRIGQRAEVYFDAFPGMRFHAKVYSLGAMATGGWRQNYYLRTLPIRLQIEGADPRVIPDLSTSADIILERKENATLVPLEAIQNQNGKSMVYVWRDGHWTPREVKLGISSNTHASAVEGLRAGEEVALDPAAAGSQKIS